MLHTVCSICSGLLTGMFVHQSVFPKMFQEGNEFEKSLKFVQVPFFFATFQGPGHDIAVATNTRNKKSVSVSFIGFTHTFIDKRHKNHSSLK